MINAQGFQVPHVCRVAAFPSCRPPLSTVMMFVVQLSGFICTKGRLRVGFETLFGSLAMLQARAFGGVVVRGTVETLLALA